MASPSDPVSALAVQAQGEERPLFATLLWRYRTERGWTQEELAERAGLSPRGIRALEQGERSRPYKHTVRLLADALELQEGERDAFQEAARRISGRERTGVIQLLEREPLPPNLPDEPTPFIGRPQEIGELRALLLRPGVRLVTLTGTGGTGKTRLALRVAGDLLSVFEDGIFLVSLAAVSDVAHVPSAIATVLGLQERAGQEIVDILKAHLATKHLLLVLDNLEHLLEARSALAALLDACRKLSLLATSRTMLHLSREYEYPVPPLSLPDPHHGADPESLARVDAVALFVERARAAKPSFALSAENAQPVAEICRRLEGLPLALELAAARIRLFPPSALLQRLSPRLSLLTGGARDLPTRLQTVRGAIDWSYSLLTEEEKTLFAYLSVFAGGYTPEAVERVCSSEDDRRTDIPEVLAALVEQSLVRQIGEYDARFVMLETIREYAAECLQQAADTEAVQRRHALYYLDLAEEAVGELVGPRRHMWLERLEGEHENLRAAMRWAREQGEVDHGLRLAIALAPFWKVRGYVREGRQWLEGLLNRSESGTGELRLRALAVAVEFGGMYRDQLRTDELTKQALDLAQQMGDQQVVVDVVTRFVTRVPSWNMDALARGWLERSERVARSLGDQALLSSCLQRLAKWKVWAGDATAALPLAEESLQLAGELRDPHLTRDAAWAVINAAGCAGDVARARALLDETMPMLIGGASQYLDPESRETTLWMGSGFRSWGEYETARRLWEQLLTVSLQEQDRWSVARMQGALAFLDREQGRYAKAQTLLENSLTVFQELGDVAGVGSALVGLGDIARDQDDAETAIVFSERALALFRELKDQEFVGYCLHNLAVSAWKQSDYAKAEKLLAEAKSSLPIDDWLWQAEVQVSVGMVALDQGAYPRAKEAFVTSLRLISHGREARLTAPNLEGMAGVAVGAGQMARAARLLGAAAALRSRIGTPLMPVHQPLYERHVAAAGTALGEEQLDHLWKEGSAMTVDEAIAYALDESTEGPTGEITPRLSGGDSG